MKSIRIIKCFLLVSVIAFVSCNTRGRSILNPEKPENAVEDRGHEMPDVVTYTLEEGNLTNENAVGSNGKHREYLGDGFKSLGEKQSVEFKHIRKNSGYEVVMIGKPFEMKPNVWYMLSIDFYNKSGKKINYQYYETEEARRLHQFFFRTFLYEDGKDVNTMINRIYGKDNVFEYKYGDKYNGSIIDPPMGFVGYIKYLDSRSSILKGNDKIVLNPLLVHSMASSKLTFDRKNKEWVPYPFDDPGKNIIGISDIDHRIVVKLLK